MCMSALARPDPGQALCALFLVSDPLRQGLSSSPFEAGSTQPAHLESGSLQRLVSSQPACSHLSSVGQVMVQGRVVSQRLQAGQGGV